MAVWKEKEDGEMSENAQVTSVRLASIGGGLSDIGNKNCYLLSVEWELSGFSKTIGFLLDCGQEIPDHSEDSSGSLAWNYVPSFSEIPENVESIQGAFISHAHRDHDGAVNKLFEFLLNSSRFLDKELPYVFMPQYAANMQQSREFRSLKRGELEERYTIAPHPDRGIERDDIWVVDSGMEVFFRIADGWHVVSDDNVPTENDIVFRFREVNHSVADSMLIAIEVGGKKIVYSGDVRLHGANQQETVRVLRETFADDAIRGADILMLDATGVIYEGSGKPEDVTIERFLRIVRENPDKRIFATMFSSQPKLLEFMRTFARMGLEREVYLHGGSMQDNVKWGHRHWPLGMRDKFIAGSWKRYPYGRAPVADNAIIFLTGSQAEPLSALSRLLNPEYNQEMSDIEINENNIVVFAARTIPGNGPGVAEILHKLRNTSCTIYYPLNHDDTESAWVREAIGPNGDLYFDDLHISGHAPRDDLQEIIEILKPKALMPIHAPKTQRGLMQQVVDEIAEETNTPAIPVILPDDLDEVVVL